MGLSSINWCRISFLHPQYEHKLILWTKTYWNPAIHRIYWNTILWNIWFIRGLDTCVNKLLTWMHIQVKSSNPVWNSQRVNVHSLWQTNVAIENCKFIVDLPTKVVTLPSVVFLYQRVMRSSPQHTPKSCSNKVERQVCRTPQGMWVVTIGLGQYIVSGWWLGHPSEKYEFVNWDD